MKVKGINTGFFVLLLVLSTLAFFMVIRPYYSAIFWAVLLALLFYPLKTRIRKWLGDKNGLSALLTLLIICLIVFIPCVIVMTSLAYEGNQLYTSLQQNNQAFSSSVTTAINHLPGSVQTFLNRYDLTNVDKLQQKISALAMEGSHTLANSALVIGQGTFSFTVGFVIMLYLLFFFLKDGAYLIGLLLDALPLSRYMKHHLLKKLSAVSKATVKGTVVVALVQGALGGLAFWFLGVQGSVLWGALMAFLSLVPAIGSAIIWAPVAIYFLAAGPLWKGIFLVVFFVVVIGLVDNILRPLLVGKETRMPDYLVLIATLGGMELFGINGFVIGPLITALFIACWNLFSGRDNAANSDQLDVGFIAEGQQEQSHSGQKED
ncbi:AI-2E family transporter [Tatumella punctata]|uniref:AI-2E family transporter n=1 Tax=Tatumella punctata TaxID=399969 RepID=A0ABW1VRX2_9GAMM